MMSLQAAYARLEVFAMTNGSYNESINDLVGIMNLPVLTLHNRVYLNYSTIELHVSFDVTWRGTDTAVSVSPHRASMRCPTRVLAGVSRPPCGLDGKYGPETTLSELQSQYPASDAMPITS